LFVFVFFVALFKNVPMIGYIGTCILQGGIGTGFFPWLVRFFFVKIFGIISTDLKLTDKKEEK
jgi:hypothetical protein